MKNTIDITHPDIADEWNYDKNGELKPSNCTAGSNKIVSWKCNTTDECGCIHEWMASIYSRTGMKSGCPYCSKNKICIHKSIEFTHPDIATQWHPTLNGDIKAYHVSKYSDKKSWWLCPNKCPEGCEHVYQSTVGNKVGNNNGCPYCCIITKKHCIHTSILSTHPQLMIEWHPTKNEIKPETIGHGCKKNAWWKCCNDHEWEAQICARASGNGCPSCKYKTQKKLLEWLKSRYPTKSEVRYPWCKNEDTGRGLPFDYEVCNNIIIELDGRQHFIQVKDWISPEKQQERDNYKMSCAFKNNKHVIRIKQEVVLKDKNNWESELETVISQLLKISDPTLRLIGIDNIYTNII